MSIFTADGGLEDEPSFENLGGYGDLVALGRRVGLLAEDELGRLLDEVACSLEEAGSVRPCPGAARWDLRTFSRHSGGRTAAVRGYGVPAPGRG